LYSLRQLRLPREHGPPFPHFPSPGQSLMLMIARVIPPTFPFYGLLADLPRAVSLVSVEPKKANNTTAPGSHIALASSTFEHAIPYSPLFGSCSFGNSAPQAACFFPQEAGLKKGCFLLVFLLPPVIWSTCPRSLCLGFRVPSCRSRKSPVSLFSLIFRHRGRQFPFPYPLKDLPGGRPPLLQVI